MSSQEQNTAVDGWNDQISQLTAECDQLKDSLQEVTKVSFLLFCCPFQPANFKPRGNCITVAYHSSSQEMKNSNFSLENKYCFYLIPD